MDTYARINERVSNTLQPSRVSTLTLRQEGLQAFMMLQRIDRHGQILYVRIKQVDSYAIHFFMSKLYCWTEFLMEVHDH